jgi:hypothetical protein
MGGEQTATMSIVVTIIHALRRNINLKILVFNS